MARQSQPVKRTRTLFFAVHRRPVREPRPCSHGNHAGPLVGSVRVETFGAWSNMGTCAACGDTVHRSQVRVVA
jgi:hypothetical protein